MNEIEIKFDKLLTYLIICSPVIFSLFSIFGYEIYIEVYFVVLLLCFITNISFDGINFKKIFVLIMLFLLIGIDYFNLGLNYIIHNDFYGFIFLCILFMFPANHESIKEIITTKPRFIKNISYIYLSILIFSIIFLNGIRDFNTYSNYKVLFGPYNLSHILAYDLLFLIILNLSILKYSNNKQPTYFLLVLFFLALLLTQVRTSYLAIIVIIIYEIFVSKTFSTNQKKYFIFISLFFITSFILFISFNPDSINKIPFLSKTITSFENGSISNGREDYVLTALTVFDEQSLFYKLYGIGLDKIRYINQTNFNVAIHYHNDIFNILVGYGLLGLFIYSISMFNFIKNKSKILFFSFLLILMYFNGLYMYTGFCIYLPIIRSIYFDSNKELER